MLPGHKYQRQVFHNKTYNCTCSITLNPLCTNEFFHLVNDTMRLGCFIVHIKVSQVKISNFRFASIPKIF